MPDAVSVGLFAERSLLVEERHTAAHWGSGGVDVLATPHLIGLMESAAVAALDSLLPEGYCSVGVRVDIQHLAATPTGAPVTAAARIVQVDGRKITFEVEAHDEVNRIGAGRHERFIVHRERFMARAQGGHSTSALPHDVQAC
jgi:fluoroacetyl-CoA thioesterase